VSRILWLGNPPFVGSGYGEQAGLFVPRLAAAGHEMAVAANWALNGVRLDWNGLSVYPADGQWGNATTPTFAKHHKADLTFALCDAWVLKPQEWPEDFRMAVWAPVDHYPVPPAVLAVLQDPKVRPVAMSKFGLDQMRTFGLDPLYVPHGVDTTIFRPRPEIKAQIRAELNIPEDAFLIGMVAANKGNPSLPRKAFPQQFTGFAQFAKTHDDAWMYVHTEAKPTGGGGIELDTMAQAVGCPVGRLRFPPEEAWQLGMSRDVVSAIYPAFDVLLNASMGEGFGVPILEAQACGVPVITSDHSAMTELTGAGWMVGGDPWWDALQTSFYLNPSINGIVEALEEAYAHRDDHALHDRADVFAQGYDADKVAADYLLPAIEELSAPRRVGPIKLNGGEPNRAMRRAQKRAKVSA
jgi:glycosyltransferase involved in cell wall biosynthesis